MRLSLLFAVLLAVPVSAQDLGPRVAPPLPDTTAQRYGSSGAVVLGLSEYGLGVGAALRGRLSSDVSATIEIGVGAGRDEREQTFSGDLGERVTPLKRNYVLLIPLQVGIEHRLFRDTVEDNFRPFAHAAAGPTLALQWPYFDDADRDGIRNQDEEILGALGGLGDGDARVGIGGTLTVGAYFGRSRRNATSLRFGLQGTYFPVEVDLLETRPDVEDASRKTFWTPVVSFHIGRLLGDG